jgi:hypothetical protein
VAFHRSYSGLVTISILDTESAIITAALVSRAVGIYFRSGPERSRSGLCPLYNEAEFNKG